jgi:hypothetical protein
LSSVSGISGLSSATPVALLPAGRFRWIWSGAVSIVRGSTMSLLAAPFPLDACVARRWGMLLGTVRDLTRPFRRRVVVAVRYAVWAPRTRLWQRATGVRSLCDVGINGFLGLCLHRSPLLRPALDLRCCAASPEARTPSPCPPPELPRGHPSCHSSLLFCTIPHATKLQVEEDVLAGNALVLRSLPSVSLHPG